MGNAVRSLMGNFVILTDKILKYVKEICRTWGKFGQTGGRFWLACKEIIFFKSPASKSLVAWSFSVNLFVYLFISLSQFSTSEWFVDLQEHKNIAQALAWQKAFKHIPTFVLFINVVSLGKWKPKLKPKLKQYDTSVAYSLKVCIVEGTDHAVFKLAMHTMPSVLVCGICSIYFWPAISISSPTTHLMVKMFVCYVQPTIRCKNVGILHAATHPAILRGKIVLHKITLTIGPNNALRVGGGDEIFSCPWTLTQGIHPASYASVHVQLIENNGSVPRYFAQA